MNIKIGFILFLFFSNGLLRAQTTRYDTIMLSVFNTGAKYCIAPAGFGADPKTPLVRGMCKNAWFE